MLMTRIPIIPFDTSGTNVSLISECLADMSSQREDHHPKLNPNNAERLYIHGDASPIQGNVITYDHATGQCLQPWDSSG